MTAVCQPRLDFVTVCLADHTWKTEDSKTELGGVAIFLERVSVDEDYLCTPPGLRPVTAKGSEQAGWAGCIVFFAI